MFGRLSVQNKTMKKKTKFVNQFWFAKGNVISFLCVCVCVCVWCEQISYEFYPEIRNHQIDDQKQELKIEDILSQYKPPLPTHFVLFAFFF